MTRIQDAHWYYGKLGTCEGRLPRSNVTGPVTLPPAQQGQPYFATLADFHEQESGDLSFKQGNWLPGALYNVINVVCCFMKKVKF